MVVVPGPVALDSVGVVVGVDGSPDSVAAVALAAIEADRIGEALYVVHAWTEPAIFAPADAVVVELTAAAREEEAVVLGESIAGLAEQYPDLVVHPHLVHDQPATALLDAAAHARLLVVGSRGRHGLTRVLLGSVSHTVVLHAECPVMVARITAQVAGAAPLAGSVAAGTSGVGRCVLPCRATTGDREECDDERVARRGERHGGRRATRRHLGADVGLGRRVLARAGQRRDGARPGAPGAVVLDAAEMEFVDSSGLAFILQVLRAAQEDGRDVLLRDPPTLLLEMLDVLGLADQVPLEFSRS